MFDPERQAALKTALAGSGPTTDPLADMSEADLRRLRDDINRLLPDDVVANLDLEAELVGQYRKTKKLMDDVLDDQECPANQKAQVANSVVGTLGQLVKLQEDLKREQTLKIMEETLVDTLKMLPEDVREEFYAEYERTAKQAGLT